MIENADSDIHDMTFEEFRSTIRGKEGADVTMSCLKVRTTKTTTNTSMITHDTMEIKL